MKSTSSRFDIEAETVSIWLFGDPGKRQKACPI